MNADKPFGNHSVSIREARFSDYIGMNLLWRRTGLVRGEYGYENPTDDPLYAGWRQLWESNPAFTDAAERLAIGWVMEDTRERIVGSFMSIPSNYHLDGKKLTAAAGSCFAVDPEYRRYSIAFGRNFINQAGIDLYVGTSAVEVTNRIIYSMFKNRVNTPPDRTIFRFYINYHKLFERSMGSFEMYPLRRFARHTGPRILRLKDVLLRRNIYALKRDRSWDVQSLYDVDDRFDRFWYELTERYPDRLLLWRDSRALRWHVGDLLKRGLMRLYALSRNGELHGYSAVCYYLRKKDRFALLADVQVLDEEGTGVTTLLSRAADDCRTHSVYTLDVDGMNVRKRKTIADCKPHSYSGDYPTYTYAVNDQALRDYFVNATVYDPCLLEGDAVKDRVDPNHPLNSPLSRDLLMRR
jgi:hypothetical protein